MCNEAVIAKVCKHLCLLVKYGLPICNLLTSNDKRRRPHYVLLDVILQCPIISLRYLHLYLPVISNYMLSMQVFFRGRGKRKVLIDKKINLLVHWKNTVDKN